MSGADAPGLLFGFAFAAEGARELRPAEAGTQTSVNGERFRWLHFDSRAAAAQEWLRDVAGFDDHAVRAALAQRVRPRISAYGDTLLLVIRTVKHEEGTSHEELASMRVLARPGMLVTLRRARLRVAEGVAQDLRGGHVCAEPAELLAHLLARVQGPLHDILEKIGERLDDFEDRVADPKQSPDRTEIADLRRELIALRKALVPQREALQRLYQEPHTALGDRQRPLLREPAHRAARQVEEMEAARERAAVLMEELSVQQSEELNRRIYLFTVIAGIFMPLTFFASLLGMNVAGIPLAMHARAFLIVCVMMAALGIGIWLLLRRHRWL
jgi:zinc transporter